MSSCSRNRWGPGTTCEKPVCTEASKELEARIAKMNQDRAKQDQMWTQPEPTPSLNTKEPSNKKPSK